MVMNQDVDPNANSAYSFDVISNICVFCWCSNEKTKQTNGKGKSQFIEGIY